MLKILMILREEGKKERLRPTPRDLWIVRAITTETQQTGLLQTTGRPIGARV